MRTRGIGMADIAIIGMAGIFPKAPDVATFWSNILNKVDAVGEAPPGWLGDESVFDPASDDLTRIYTRHGGFLGPLSRFDPRPYGTMPVSVMGGEPDQFLALEVADRALADAGLAGKLDGERTGIVLGHGIHANRANVNGMQHGIALDQTIGLLKAAHPHLSPAALAEIRGLLKARLPPISVDVIPGLVPNMMTGRIANRLDLMGPNYIIDAACASSLLSVEAAVLELRRGRADVMIAGGVNTTTSPLVYMVFCQLGALSRNSRVRPFDGSADGTILGEGLGMVVLKRLDDALAAGDRIYAVIKAVGQSSDGRGGGLMAPRFEGEVLAMRRAYEESGLDPATIGLVEAHGTGIPLGDRTEIRSLRAVMGGRSRPYPHIPIGSVKSMIGHCIPAAGSASLIKMALSLHGKIVPPTLCDVPSAELDFDDTPFYVATQAEPWIHGGEVPRRAAINSFGFGGINAHLVLEEAPGGSMDAGAAFAFRPEAAGDLVVLGQAGRPALLAEIDSLIARARQGVPLTELARESWARVVPGDERLAVVASDAADLARKLEQARAKLAVADCERIQARGGSYFTNRPLRGKVAFLFPGENSQFPGMLQDLGMAFPLVRGWFDFLEGLFGGRDLPPRALIFPPSSCLTGDERARLEKRLRDVDAGSEAVFTADQALFGLLMAFGIRPDFMVGHSTGESAAIIASGATGFDSGQMRDYVRSMNAIFQTLKDEGRIPTGSLLNVGAVKRDTLLAVIAEFEPRGLYFTMDNCPNQAILFGPDAVVAEVSARLSAEGGMCQPLPLEWPYHTPLIAPMAEAFAQLFQDVEPRAPIGRLFSCADAQPFPENRAAFLATANSQYTSRVRFTELIGRLWDEGARLFVECGPSGHLTAFVGDILGDKAHLAVAANVRRRTGLAQLMHMLAQLFVHQAPIDPAPLLGGRASAAPPRKVPPLASELPFIRLEAPAVERLRALVGAGTPAAAAAPPPTAAPLPVPVPSPAAPRRQDGLTGHFDLMNRFLAQQQAVALGAASPVRDLKAALALDFPAAAVFVPAEAALPETGLTAAERAWRDANLAGRSERRRREWLAGRIAAKAALRGFLAESRGMALPLDQIEILPDRDGKPVPTLANPAFRLDSMPSLSISHAAGAAVAVVADRPVGIDIEAEGRLKDPDGVARLAFGEGERALAATAGTLRLWCIKEAAAKAFGIGVAAPPGKLEVVALNEVRSGGRSARVALCGFGRFTVAVAATAS